MSSIFQLDDRFKNLLNIIHAPVLKEELSQNNEFDRLMNQNVDPEIIGRDPRFELHVFPSGNIYVVRTVEMDISIAVADEYFGKRLEKLYSDGSDEGPRSPVCSDEVGEALGNSKRGSVRYMKKFDDGVIQIAGFGRRFSSLPNKCHAIYGHIVPRTN